MVLLLRIYAVEMKVGIVFPHSGAPQYGFFCSEETCRQRVTFEDVHLKTAGSILSHHLTCAVFLLAVKIIKDIHSVFSHYFLCGNSGKKNTLKQFN